MTDKVTTTVPCPNCGETIEFKKWFLEDRFAVAYCKSPDCFYIFYPSTGEELSRKEYQAHQRAPKRPLTLGISPDRVRGTFHSDNEPQHLQVPCPECGRIFHQTKRLNRLAKFKCPRCKQRFEMDPRKCILDPRLHHAGRVSKGISPDRIYPTQERPPIKYVTTQCVNCSKDVKFVEDILKIPNHVVICKECQTCFDPSTKSVVMTGRAKPKPGLDQDEVKRFLAEKDKK